MLQDPSQRSIGYLRLSLTKACAMRCTYCRPEALHHPPGEESLTAEEIERLVRHLAVYHGVRKVRLTGGEPTSRADLLEIIRRIREISQVQDLAMTTNGLMLARHATDYVKAGLTRVNVSLDSLEPSRFTKLTGVDGLDRVRRGIDVAVKAGLMPLRLNTVVVRHANDTELPMLVRFAAEKGLEIRFIELMPMGPLASHWQALHVPEAEMRQTLQKLVQTWRLMPQGVNSARRYKVVLHNGQRAVIGFISAMSCNFCRQCNRLRIASDGAIYPCLMGEPAGSLLSALRPRFDPQEVDRRLVQSLTQKAPEHGERGFVVMTHIGG